MLYSERIHQDQKSQSPDKIQIMCRSCKRLSHVSINNSTEINDKFVLACIQTGTGQTPEYFKSKFKGIERNVGKQIEQVV